MASADTSKVQSEAAGSDNAGAGRANAARANAGRANTGTANSAAAAASEPLRKRERRVLKKYPNRRLYDTRLSAYVTIEDVRQYILKREAIQVLDSKTQHDITRTVLMQIISEQENEGHEPLLTNRVLEVLIRFYGEPGYGYLGRFLEQSISTFLEQQRRYQQHMQTLIESSPVRLMQQLAEQNTQFWRSLLGGVAGSGQDRAANAAPSFSGAAPDSGPSRAAQQHAAGAGTGGNVPPSPDAAEPDADTPLDEGIELQGAGIRTPSDRL